MLDRATLASLTDTGLHRRIARRRREVEAAEALPDLAGGPVVLAARLAELERLEREADRRVG